MRTAAIGFTAAAVALALSTIGCSDNGTGTAAIVTTAPSSSTWVTATISSPVVTPQAPFVFQSNVTTGVQRSANFNILIAASRTVTMSSAMVHLTDGSNLGGPSVTFPQPELTSLFGSTLIFAGTTRLFAFNPFFGPSLTPFGLSANLTFVDLNGMSNTIFVSTPIR